MRKEYILLVTLALIWGCSFMFMKVLVPVFGPIYTAGFRLLVGALFLFVIALIKNITIFKKEYFKHFIIMGIFNSAIPFFLFASAAQYIPSTISVIANSLTPVFTALLTFLVMKENFPTIKKLGLLFGFIGVSISSFTGNVDLTSLFILGVVECVIATFLYASCAIYYRKYIHNVQSIVISCGSMFVGSLLLLPLAFFNSSMNDVVFIDVVILIAFGILGSGVAYLIYFHLLNTIGPVKTTTLSFIQPIFGVLAGIILLSETININFIVGAILTLLGVYLIMRVRKESE